MKKMILAMAGAAVSLVSFAGAAQAAPGPDQRAAHLSMRIDQGARTGRLTPREAARLRMRVARVDRFARHERRGRLDERRGRLAQKREVNRRFDAVSAKVRIEKHSLRG